MAKIEKKGTVKVVVAKGKTVDVGGEQKGPGSVITLPADEADDLNLAGFVIAAGDAKEEQADPDSETQ